MAILLSACATPVSEEADDTAADALASNPWAVASTETSIPDSRWEHLRFPGKRPNAYQFVRLDGRDAMLAKAISSTSMLRQNVHVTPGQLHHLRFSWKVPALIESADLTVAERSDSPVRVVLAFDGDRSKFSARDAMLSELAHALTGEPMPYATLMYVWGNHSQPGTVLTNTRTGRIRELVMESGPGKLGQWLDYERDVRADFVRAFGEEPGALVAIGIMTDTDNTRSTAHAWYGPVRHLTKAAADAAPLADPP